MVSRLTRYLRPCRAQIVAAAEAAHVDQFVRTLPDGYDTIIDEATSSAGGSCATPHRSQFEEAITEAN